jgi:hypothetical protein
MDRGIAATCDVIALRVTDLALSTLRHLMLFRDHSQLLLTGNL